MHYWGDEWFQQYGNQLYKAINEIETYLRKHHIGVCGKEKYGTYRDEFLTFWDGGLYQILFGYRACINTFNSYQFHFKKDADMSSKTNKCKAWYNKHIGVKLHDFANKAHKFIYFKLDYAIPAIPNDVPFEDYSKYYDKRIWLGLVHYNSKIGLTWLVHKYQAYHYNKIFQKTCKKYPDIITELIVDANGYKMIKPGIWGKVDGQAIHNMYWK